MAPLGLALAWSPDGRTVATVSPSEQELRLWEVAGGQSRRPELRLRFLPRSVAFSPDGRLVAVGGVGFRLFDVWTGKELATRAAHAGPPLFLAFTPDGRFLISAGADLSVPNPKGPDSVTRGDTTALVWDVAALVKDLPAVPRPAAADIEGLWEALKGDDPAKAHDAVWRLAAAPELALPLVRERLPKVAPEGFDRRVKKLLVELDDDDFGVREQATQELIRLGSAALPAVKQELAATKSREVRRRAEEVVAKVGAGPAARPEEVLLARGFEVLQRLGTAEARALLEEWAKGPADAPLAREAKLALAMTAKPR
jgi:hypothetical protein